MLVLPNPMSYIPLELDARLTNTRGFKSYEKAPHTACVLEHEHELLSCEDPHWRAPTFLCSLRHD